MTTEVEPTFVDREAVQDQVVAEVVGQLQAKTGDPVDASRIGELVEVEWARHDGARVRTFLPVLVRRAVLAQVLGG